MVLRAPGHVHGGRGGGEEGAAPPWVEVAPHVVGAADGGIPGGYRELAVFSSAVEEWCGGEGYWGVCNYGGFCQV